jgi:hypothetical protein
MLAGILAGFRTYFLNRITAVLSDSENTMKKLHRLMDRWIYRRDYQGNPITLVHLLCLAHKVQEPHSQISDHL